MSESIDTKPTVKEDLKENTAEVGGEVEKKAATKVEKTAATEEKFNPPPGERLYEAMWLVDAGLGRENPGKVLDELKELVEREGGTWVNGDKWDERRLAYPIRRKKRGLYVLSHFTSPPKVPALIERRARLTELVLRVLITNDEDGLSIAPPTRGPSGEGRFVGGGDRRGRGGGKRFGDRGRDRGHGKRERSERKDAGTGTA